MVNHGISIALSVSSFHVIPMFAGIYIVWFVYLGFGVLLEYHIRNLVSVCPTRGGLRKTHPTSKIEFSLTNNNIEQNIIIYIIIVKYHCICEKIYNIRIIC